MNKSHNSYVTKISLIAALGGLLFGYDTAVINGSVGFLEKHFTLNAAMTGWLVSCALVGCVLGVSFAGMLCDRFGRKFALVSAGVLFLLSSIGTAVPQTFTQLIVFRILAGLGVGIASMVSPMYIAEVSPADRRGRLVSMNQMAIISGMLLIYFVNYIIARQGGAEWQIHTSWRWMFASGILPSALFLGLLFFAPESPRWLAQEGRDEKARAVLARIGGADFAQSEIAEIQASFSASNNNGGARVSLFANGMWRVVLLGLTLAVLQQVTGINVFLYFGTEIFKKLGSSVDAALLETVAVGAVNLLFTLVAVKTVDRAGRRPLMLIGSAGMGVCLVAMGLMGHSGNPPAGMIVLVLGYIAFFALSVGPVTWVILTEIFPIAIRARALSVATIGLWISNFTVSQTFPMMDSSPWLVARFGHSFPFYVYGALCVVLLAVVFLWVPETKGRTLEDIGAHGTKRPRETTSA